MNTSQTGNPAVRHVERYAEAFCRGERDMDGRYYPVTLFALSSVILA
jgi:hypothetical protein